MRKHFMLTVAPQTTHIFSNFMVGKLILQEMANFSDYPRDFRL